MGDVYLAEDPQIERPLAIKTVKVAEGRPEEIEDRKRRLLREAKTAGRLIHPHVVTLFDASEAEGVLFLAFEYVKGQDLSQRQQQSPPLTLGAVLRIVRETAEALDFAHHNGIVHRDVKPSNILLDAQERVKVSDFGIAKLVGQATELTMTGSVVGSPFYLSPEQVRGEELDGRSDLFSLGVVLYELLGHRRPFAAESLTTLVYQILHQEPAPLASLRADLAPRLEGLVRRLMAKERDARCANAREVVDEIATLERELPREALAAPAAADLDSTRLLQGAEAQATAPTAVRPPAPPSTPAPVPPPGAAPAVPAAAPTSASGKRAPLALLLVVGIVVLGGLGVAGWLLLGRAPSPPSAESSATVVPPAGGVGGRPGVERPREEPPASEPRREPVPIRASPEPAPPAAPASERPGDAGREPAGGPAVTRPPAAESPAPETSRPAARPPVAPPASEPAARVAAAPEPPAAAPEPAPSAAALPEFEREMNTGLVLAFRAQPGDTFVTLRELSERRGTLLGRAADYSGQGREARSYTLPGPGTYLLTFKRDGMDDYRVLVRAASGGPGLSPVSVVMGRRRAAGASTASLETYRAREAVGLRVEPESATVVVDGVERGPARDFTGGLGRGRWLKLDPGTHRIELVASGHRTLAIAVEVTPGAAEERLPIKLRLERE
jgi:serine/threonine-protein kinase